MVLPHRFPVSYFVSEIRVSEFDLNQFGPQKFNWIEPPGAA